MSSIKVFFGIRQLQCISKIDRAIFDNLLTISLNSDDATTRRSVFNYFGRTAFAKNSNISDDYKRDVVIAALNLLETETDENVIYGAVHAIGVQAQSISFNSELYEKFIQRSSSVTPDSSVPHVLSLFRTMELANNRILENSKAALDQEDMINAYYILRQHEDDNFIAAGIRGLKNFGVQDEDIIRYVVRSSYDTESDFVFYVALKHFRNEIVANKDLHDFLFGDYLDEYGWDLHLLIMDIINELPELTEDQLGILKNYSESGLYEEAREVAESIYNKHTRSKIGLLLQYFRK